MTHSTTNHDFEQLIRDARLQRTATIANALVQGIAAIGAGLKNAFVFDRTTPAPKLPVRQS